MPHQFVVYIDESGDEGFVFRNPPARGSSNWFILTATMITKEHDARVRELAANIRSTLRYEPKHVLHFSDLDHEQCVPACDAIGRAGITVSSVLINKRAIQNAAIFQEAPFRLYYYTARLLLERISWFCRDTARRNRWPTCLARIIFEHRKRLSYDNLKEYLNILRGQAREDAWLNVLLNDVRIHWPAVHNDYIEPARKDQFAGLQISDLVAGGLRAALDNSPWGHTEHRYAKLIEPATYRHNGNCLSYGLKFFPNGLAADDQKGHWVRKHYT